MASGYSDLSEIRKDGRSPFGGYPKPPKINLLNEKPRRESVIEQQLTTKIIRPTRAVPYQQQQPCYSNNQQPTLQQQQVFRSHELPTNYNDPTTNHQYRSPTREFYDRDYEAGTSFLQDNGGPSVISTRHKYSPELGKKTIITTVKTTTTTTNRTGDGSSSSVIAPPPPPRTSSATVDYSALEAELAEKEAKLKRELAYLNEQLSPWSRPRQIREPRREPPPRAQRGGCGGNDQRWVKECPLGGGSRPTSRASSSRSSTIEADLMEKAAKLLQDVEELEKKPLNAQQIIIGGGAGGKTANFTSGDRLSHQVPSSSSGLHTAIIKTPRNQVNNKSPLPFSFDNFSTLGVRGNIASVGAAEPDTPYPPIFPQIKRA